MDPKHARGKSASFEKEVVMVTQNGHKPFARKVLVLPPRGESKDPLAPKAKGTTKGAPKAAKAATPKTKAPSKRAL